MTNPAIKIISRKTRHKRIRKRVSGTDSKPRLCVFRSSTNIYAQLINDIDGATLISVSSINNDLKPITGTKTEKAGLVGKKLGEKALEKGITEVVFDRCGYKYHGRIKALADASREVGLKF
jgi:large subunit ribosomal protein L18